MANLLHLPHGMSDVHPRPGHEAALLTGHVGGNPHAFRELVRTWAAPIYGYLVRSGIRGAEADDLFQDICCRIHSAADRYEPDRPLRPWIFTIVVNAVRNHVRDRSTRERAHLALVGDTDLNTPSPTPQAAVEAAETAAWLQAEIRELPAPEREVVVLCCIEQMEQKDAAEALGIPLNTLKTHLRRARLRLAQALVRRRRTAESAI